MTFSDCLFLPDHSHNLISVSKLRQNGAQVNFGKSLSIFVNERATILFEEHANLYVLKGKTFDFCSFSGENEKAVLWHHRLGHNNFKNVKRLAHHVSGMSLKHSAFDKLCCCEVCKISKSRRQPVSRKMEKRKSSKLDLVFTDILGPMPTTSLGGNRYAISFTDSYSRYSAVYYLKSKEECLDKFKVFCAQVGTPRAIRSDNGKEYISMSFRSFCISNRIKREHTAPYSPHQNGVSERRWRTTVEMARCMLKTAKLGTEFWVRALHTAFYISNRCLTVSLPKSKTPFEMFFGKKPDLSNLKVFGCTAFKHIETHQDKLSDKATKEVFVGYSEDSEAYISYNPYSKKTSFSRNVSFDETSFDFFAAHPSQNIRAFVTKKPAPKQVLTETQKHFCEMYSVPILPTETLNDFETETTPSPVDVVSSENIDANESSAFLRSRSGRVIKPPAYLDDYVLLTDDGDENLFYREAMKSSLKSEWIEATQKEYDALIENKTWVLSPLPLGRKAIGSRWVFKIKRHDDGTIEKFKVRFVAQGFSQVFGNDYDETFAPTAKLCTLRICFALAASWSTFVFQLDVRSAFLNANLSDEIYIEQPEGFAQAGANGETLYCKLQFVQSVEDHCLFRCDGTNGSQLFVLVWVDDILYFSNNDKMLHDFKAKLSDAFSIDDRGIMPWFLGCNVEQSRGRISLSQRSYIKDILRKSHMSDCKPVSTPAIPHTKQSKSDCPIESSEKSLDICGQKQYRSLVGNLMYLSVVSRPDICFAVYNLAQFVSNPGKAHWCALKHLLRFLKGTESLSLVYNRSENLELFGFSDSDWATDKDDCKSTSGFCFKLSRSVSVVSWASKKQGCVALSSCEAEYVSLALAAQEAVYLQGLLLFFCLMTVDTPVLLCGDNQGALALASNPVAHKRAKHIETRHHFIRQLVEDKRIQLSYVPTKNNLADIITKKLPKPAFNELSSQLFVIQPPRSTT